MVRRVKLTVLLLGFLVSSGILCLGNSDRGGLHSGAVGLPWKDELCCESRSAHSSVEGEATHAPQPNGSQASLPDEPQCRFKSLTSRLHPPELSGTCLDILCSIDEKRENLTCNLQPLTLQDAGHMTVRLQPWSPAVDSENQAVTCKAEGSFMCSVALGAASSFDMKVTVNISDARAPSVLLTIPAPPVKPVNQSTGPPVNLSHVQTIEAKLILRWADPNFKTGNRYEVRYSPETSHPAWQVRPVSGETRTFLDLKPRVNYTVQVRRSSLHDPPLWSRWSESHHIFLDSKNRGLRLISEPDRLLVWSCEPGSGLANADEVSYIPEKVVARPGENVTVYCVFNDHNLNASTALWILNFNQQLDHSQFHPVNQWVSQVTMRPSETGMYDLLQCTQKWTIPYSQIYVEGASIDIRCETNGNIDAMDCRWNSTQWMNPTFRYRWADLSCDVMEERERAGQKVGHEGPSCLQIHHKCTIQPLKTNCYKLWLEVPSHLGPIRSKPVYLAPYDHVKPHPPAKVKATSRSSGVLTVTWQPPPLPAEGLQCQLRYHSASALRAKPDWEVRAPVREWRAEVAISDMCRMFVVQVRCMHVNGTGYWSEWSDSVDSTPQNSRAPSHGPNFWRVLQDDPSRKQTKVTLLFKHLQLSGQPYCVDGFIVQRRNSTGSVVQEHIPVASSYSFEWNQTPQTVTVEAYNSLGSSSNNVRMTLEKTPKRRCVRSFSVMLINSTCVSLSWTLMDHTSVPLSMVVQWSLVRNQDSDHHRGPSADMWVRLPYSDHPTYLRGNFFGSEDCGFYLYPVFADGEGEPVYTTATRGDPAIYMLLMIISFLSFVLLVSLILSQNQMKKLMWKDVPNPNQCSWARGLDLDKANTFDHMFRPPEGFPAWPLLLPSENISKVVIVDKVDLSALSASRNPTAAVSMHLLGGADSQVERAWPEGSELLPGEDASPPPNLDYSEADGVRRPLAADTASSAQSSVTYTTVLLCDPKQQQQPLYLHDKDGGGCSSSDEGNFSANNSDISGSFPGGLLELDDPRRSCSYMSVEELSETSEHSNREAGEEKDLYYLGLDYGADESEEEEPKALNREGCSVELRPLLEPTNSTCNISVLYLPQFRTGPSSTRQLPPAQPQGGQRQL